MELKEASKITGLPIERLQYREDGRIEWICKHGIGHTVYAPKIMSKYGFVHGCDGCCNDIEIIIEK